MGKPKGESVADVERMRTWLSESRFSRYNDGVWWWMALGKKYDAGCPVHLKGLMISLCQITGHESRISTSIEASGLNMTLGEESGRPRTADGRRG